MACLRKGSGLSVAALAIALVGCGGGGGIASIPPPPTTPLPPPAAGALSIGAPAIAAVPNGNLFPLASDTGPTLTSHSETTFPLLESVISVNSTEVKADTASINAGGTLTFDSSQDPLRFNLGNASAGVTDVGLARQDSGSYQAGRAFLPNELHLTISEPAKSQLDWTSYGSWDVLTGGESRHGAFVTGYVTPIAAVPTTGSAHYTGSTTGEVVMSDRTSDGQGQGTSPNPLSLSGSASIDANFGTGSVVGNLSNMLVTGPAGALPWNDVRFSASFASGQNLFTGTSAAASAPGNRQSLGPSATGTVAGLFFGPHGGELGAVWTLSDQFGAAIGSIGARRNDACTACWDY